jgi:hypothetical protein
LSRREKKGENIKAIDRTMPVFSSRKLNDVFKKTIAGLSPFLEIKRSVDLGHVPHRKY